MTRLPLNYLYTASHYWLSEQNGTWRVGLTQFGTRLLGEMVDYGFEVVVPDTPIQAGQIIGWIEGLKAVSDVCCIVDGKFRRINERLAKDPEILVRDCFGEGWIYEAVGSPNPRTMHVQGYRAWLDKTIDELLEKQRSSE